jgi:ABC-type multidrug transport system fused ATPase/permease subunit/CBS domain-containing protein
MRLLPWRVRRRRGRGKDGTRETEDQRARGKQPSDRNNLWRFLAVARPYRGLIVMLVLIGVARFALPLVTPWGVRILIDETLKNIDHLTAAQRAARIHQIHWVTFLLTLALIVRVFFLYAESILTGKLGNRLVFDLRRRLYTHIHRLSLSFFDRKQVGSIGSRVLNDISVAQTLISGGVLSLALDTVTLVLMVAILFHLEWRLTLVSLVVLPGYVITLRRLNPRIRSSSHEIQEKFSQISGTVYESLAGIQVVQAFTQERAGERRFVRETHGHYDRLMARVRLNAWLSALTTFFTGLGTVLLLWAGGLLVLEGSMTPGTLVQFYSYVAFLYGPLARFADLNQVYQTAMAAVDRVFEVFDTEPDVTDTTPDGATGRRGRADGRPPEATTLRGRVTFEDVSFGYTPDRLILKNINLTVEPGQMVAFVGPSGSGKTTVTKLLLRFYDITDGVIRFDRYDIRDLPLRELRQQVGVVLQEPILFTGSVRDNILFGRPAASEEEVVAAAKAANAHDFITALPEGYDTLVGERGSHLSGGQRQRVSIARALLKDPKILILDEATSALDSESERLIQEALERLMQGRTSFVIAHRLSTIINADQIVVLDQGRIVEQGTHEELLLRNGLYAELCAKQFIGHPAEAEGAWFDRITVADVMSTELAAVREETPVNEMARHVQQTHHHGFPVVNDAGDLIGMVTLSDIEGAALEGRGRATVGDICTRRPLVCHPDETLGEALRQWGARDVGRLPVVDRGNPRRLLGMLRRADVVSAYSRFAPAPAPGSGLGARESGVFPTPSSELRAPSSAEGGLGGLRFLELRLGPDDAAVGREVRELSLPQECILVSIRRGTRARIPHGDTRLQAGDLVVALTHPASAPALREALGVAQLEGRHTPGQEETQGGTG